MNAISIGHLAIGVRIVEKYDMEDWKDELEASHSGKYFPDYFGGKS